MKTAKIEIWIKAFRLRTLPLALANALMGSFLALSEGSFRGEVFVLTILTITFLQILSNLANDYGDAVSGKDTAERVGPQRVTATGMVTRKEMKNMVIVFVLLSFFSGSLLIYFGLKGIEWKQVLLFFALGIAAIFAAIKYTVGKSPYGYKGFGDIFVFVFFGLVGVIGTFYLHTHWFDRLVVIPAAIIGLFSTAVLNINNLRDIRTDRDTGKNTLVVKFGSQFSQQYHLLLVGAAWFFALGYTILNFHSLWQFLFLVTLPLFIRNCLKVFNYKDSSELNSELKNLALATFFFALTFGVGLIL